MLIPFVINWSSNEALSLTLTSNGREHPLLCWPAFGPTRLENCDPPIRKNLIDSITSPRRNARSPAFPPSLLHPIRLPMATGFLCPSTASCSMMSIHSHEDRFISSFPGDIDKQILIGLDHECTFKPALSSCQATPPSQWKLHPIARIPRKPPAPHWSRLSPPRSL